MDNYEIAFSGQTVLGADLEQVKDGVRKLFNANEQLMQQLFSGRRVVIKQKVDQTTAAKYQAAFSAAGAILEVKKLAEKSEALFVAKDPEPAVSSAQPEPTEQVEQSELEPEADKANTAEVAGYMSAFSHIQAPDFAIAPAGTDMQDKVELPELPEIDVSGISIAEVGSDMGQLVEEKQAVAPDISHLAIVEP